MHTAPACSSPARPGAGAQLASEVHLALHQLVTDQGKGRPASLSPALQRTAHQADGQELF